MKIKNDKFLKKWNKCKTSQSLFDHNTHKTKNNYFDNLLHCFLNINGTAKLVIDRAISGVAPNMIVKQLLNLTKR